jgi:hypothetical protein
MKTFREIISDFQRRALEIDCFDMSLSQKTLENPISFEGKGYIRQTLDDKLTCKIYVEKTVNTDQWGWMKRSLSAKSGQLYSESDYFDLAAKDANGVVWTAAGFLPNCNWRSEEVNPIVTSDLDAITMERAAAGSEHSVYLHFFEDAELPLMIDTYNFSHDNYTFAVKKLEGAFTVEVSSNNALPENFGGRVQEALRFILAQSISWRAGAPCAPRTASGKHSALHLRCRDPETPDSIPRSDEGSRTLTLAIAGTCFPFISSIS